MYHSSLFSKTDSFLRFFLVFEMEPTSRFSGHSVLERFNDGSASFIDWMRRTMAEPTLDADVDLESWEEEESIETSDTSETVFMSYTDDEKTVSFVDLERYLGKWYEIATYVIPFQTGCTGSTATYALDGNDVAVTNECMLESLDGEYKVDTARAVIVNEETNAELLVVFLRKFRRGLLDHRVGWAGIRRTLRMGRRREQLEHLFMGSQPNASNRRGTTDQDSCSP